MTGDETRYSWSTPANAARSEGTSHSEGVPRSEGASRTKWDAIVEIIKLFGAAAPSVVILVGAVYAVMTFHQIDDAYYKELNKARDDAAKEFQDQLKIANDAVIKSSTTMVELGKAQLQSLQQTMELQANATDRMAKAQETYEQLRTAWQQRQEELEEQIHEKEQVVAREQDSMRTIEQNLKTTTASLDTLKTELANLEKSRDVATKTLGTLGTLVDEAPDLLRAVATTEGVRNVLSQSTALLDETVLTPSLQYDRVQIVLAFADLEGFIGDPRKQYQLADGAVGLINALRTDRHLSEIGLTSSVIDADEAMAHVFLGAASAAQQEFSRAIDETKKGIALYDLALASEAADSARRVKWQKHEAEAYEQLGRVVDRYQHDYDAAVGSLQQAVDIFAHLQKQYPGDWSATGGIAWARFHVAEVERDHQAFDVAADQYQLARTSIEAISDYARRSNDWLNRMAAINNASGLLLLDEVSSSVQTLDIGKTSAAKGDSEQKLNQALGYITKAKSLTEQLVQSDTQNLAWQTAQGWSLHNLGAVELALGTITPSVAKLNDSVEDLGKALSVRIDLCNKAPGRLDWRMDLRFTQMHLTAAKGRVAEQEKDYSAMRDAFVANVKLVDEALKDDPDSDDWWWHRADNQLLSADAAALLGRVVDARQTYAEVRAAAVKRIEITKQKSESDRWAAMIKRIDKSPQGHS